ncbi:TspO protein [Parcubacteria bacterium DG_72]|nr:MAG: TspO protein [Parcubacteria bacterium DG_72]
MKYKRLIISLALPQIAGLIGSLFTFSAIATWYAVLEKPSFSPPNWIFGPVWILLYVLMGISIYLIWSKAEEDRKAKGAVWLFWLHLFFNASWSVVFFGLKNPGLAFFNIIIIWVLIVVLMIKFWQIRKWSAILLIPYLLWVSFASVLNYFIWQLN